MDWKRESSGRIDLEEIRMSMDLSNYIKAEMSMGADAKLLFEDLQGTLDHGIIVARLARMVAEELGETEAFCQDMALAGFLHDVGKMRLGRYLYGRKKDMLGIEEMKYIRMHPQFSYEILKKLDYNDMILKAVYYHHENFDGSGYPDNLKETEIPYGARILRICDVLAALVSERPYRSAFPVGTAIELLIEEARNYDLRIFLALQRVLQGDGFARLMPYILAANQSVWANKTS